MVSVLRLDLPMQRGKGNARHRGSPRCDARGAGARAGNAHCCAGGAVGHQLHHAVPGRRCLQAAGLWRRFCRRAAQRPRRGFCRRWPCADIAQASPVARSDAPRLRGRDEGRGEPRPRDIPHRRRHDRPRRPQSYTHLAAGSRAVGLGGVAQRVWTTRRSLHQDAEEARRRGVLGGTARHAPARDERSGTDDERYRPREDLSQRRQVHRHPGPFRRRGGQLHAPRTGHHRQAAAAARLRRRAVQLLRLSQACAFRRAGDQARSAAGQERAGDPPGGQRGRAKARQFPQAAYPCLPATPHGRARSRRRRARPHSKGPPRRSGKRQWPIRRTIKGPTMAASR